MSYGEKLRKARKASGLTQAQAADVLKISKRQLEKIESGEVLPPSERQAITRERLLATLENLKAAPGRSNAAVSNAMNGSNTQTGISNRVAL